MVKPGETMFTERDTEMRKFLFAEREKLHIIEHICNGDFELAQQMINEILKRSLEG